VRSEGGMSLYKVQGARWQSCERHRVANEVRGMSMYVQGERLGKECPGERGRLCEAALLLRWRGGLLLRRREGLLLRRQRGLRVKIGLLLRRRLE
jgi:hypothetical protein